MPRARTLTILAGAAAPAAVALALVPAAAPAATFTVTTTADRAGSTCGSTCSLRQAVRAANAAPGPDVITLPAGTLRLTRVGADSTAAAGDLDVREELRIVGQGAGRTRIDAQGVERALELRAGGLRLSGLTVRGGSAGAAGGGAVRLTSGAFSAEDVVLRDGRGQDGANLLVGKATALLTRSAILEGRATGTGGGAAVRSGGSLTTENLTAVGNRAARGGAFAAAGAGSSLQVLAASLRGNVASGTGDSIQRDSGASVVVRGTILDEATGAGESANDACGFPAGEAPLNELARSIDPATSCGAGTDVRQATDPQTAALAPGDGANAVPVVPLLATSPAVDALTQGPKLDVRGFQRPAGNGFDVGAFEANASLDLVAPRATLGGAREARRSTVLDRGLTLTVRCDEPCSSTVRLTRSGRTAAKSTTATKPRSERKVDVRPKSSSNRSSVRRATELTLRVQVADRFGNTAEAKRTIRVR